MTSGCCSLITAAQKAERGEGLQWEERRRRRRRRKKEEEEEKREDQQEEVVLKQWSSLGVTESTHCFGIQSNTRTDAHGSCACVCEIKEDRLCCGGGVSAEKSHVSNKKNIE